MDGTQLFQRGAGRTKLVAIIIVLALGIPTLIFADKAYQNYQHSPKTAAKRFVSALEAHDYEKMSSMYTNNYKKQIDNDMWKAQVDSFFSEDNKPELVNFGAVNDTGHIYKNQQPQRAEYQFDFKGVTYEMKMVLLKNGDTWHIDEVVLGSS
jgi:hypothetical protein